MNANRALTETVGTQVLDFGRQQQETQKTLNDQQETVKGISLEIQKTVAKQASLAQSTSTQHMEVKEFLQSQAQDHSRAFASQISATSHVGFNVKDIKAQVEAIKGLQLSLAGFVSITPLIQKARSEIVDNSKRLNSLSGAYAPAFARGYQPKS